MVLAALLLVVPLALVRFDFGTSDQVTRRFAVLLGLMSVLTTLLFAAAGTVIALAVRAYARNDVQAVRLRPRGSGAWAPWSWFRSCGS